MTHDAHLHTSVMLLCTWLACSLLVLLRLTPGFILLPPSVPTVLRGWILCLRHKSTVHPWPVAECHSAIAKAKQQAYSCSNVAGPVEPFHRSCYMCMTPRVSRFDPNNARVSSGGVYPHGRVSHAG